MPDSLRDRPTLHPNAGHSSSTIRHGHLRSRLAGASAIVLASLLSAGRAFADPVSVSYSAAQVSGSEWQYTYHLAGTFASGDDLVINFPLASSGSLSDLGTGGSDWSTYVLQPDPSLPADGEFDIVANNSSPSLAPAFSVQFAYSGIGTPAAQTFTLYDASFGQLQTGFTETLAPSPVPEPNSLALLGSGALALFGLLRLRHG